MTSVETSIGILGGTGPAGKGFAVRLAKAGYDTVIGSRLAERGQEISQGLREHWSSHGIQLACLSGGDNALASTCDVVVVATPWEGAEETAASLSHNLAGKVVISMCNALMRVNGEFQPLILPRGSIGESIQAVLPESKVAAALHHVPAKELGELGEAVECDVLICSDSQEAADTTSELIGQVPGLRGLQVGGMSCAGPVEAFTAVLLQLNVRNKTRVGLRFTGLGNV